MPSVHRFLVFANPPQPDALLTCCREGRTAIGGKVRANETLRNGSWGDEASVKKRDIQEQATDS